MSADPAAAANAAVISGGSDDGMPGEGEKPQQNQQERKIRREIANSNERRRMQSINAGFQSLRTLLPHHEGEKLSKAAILQQTAEYIYSLEQEKTRLLSQNCHLKRMISLAQQQGFGEVTSLQPPTATDEPEAKRIKTAVQSVQQPTTAAVEPRVTAAAAAPVPTTVVTPHPPAAAATAAAPTRVALVAPVAGTAQIVVQQPDDRAAGINANFVRLDRQPEVVETSEKIIVGPDANMVLKPATALPPGIKVEVVPPPAPQQQAQPPPPQLRLLQPEVVTVAQPTSQPPAAVMNLSRPAEERSYVVANNGSSKQNLDSIVEAIKHLEGDHLFSPNATTARQQQQQQITTTTEAIPQEVVQEGIVSYTVGEGGELSDSKGNSIIILKNCN